MKLEPHDHIIAQLTDQGVQFELVQESFDPSKASPVSTVIAKWKNIFIGTRTAPHLDRYLWHIFSYGAAKCSEGADAEIELSRQYAAEMFIFNEAQEYLIRCWGKIPVLQEHPFREDIYLCHHNMKWTYVIPHEAPDVGPYFSKGD